MKTRVEEQIASAGKESIIKWWNHDSGSIFINSLLRRAIMDHTEKLNKFAYERWMHGGKNNNDINKFYELDEEFSELRGYELESEWSHVAIESLCEEKCRYKCITGEVYYNKENDCHIVAGVDVDDRPYTCEVNKINIHYFPNEVHQFKTYCGDREVLAIARMIKPVKTMGK